MGVNNGIKSPLAKLKTWSDNEILTDEDLNAEIDNLYSNLDASTLGSAINDGAGFLASQLSPGTYASPTVPTTQEEVNQMILQRIADIIGGDNGSFLDAVPTTLNSLSTASEGLAIGLEFEGRNGGASTSTDVLGTFINQGGIINALSLSSADVVAADFDSTNVKFGKFSYALGSGNVMAFPGQECNTARGTISTWFRNLAAGDYIAYNPLLGIELYCESVAGNLEAKITEKTAASQTSKTENTVTGSTSRTGDSTFRHVAMKWRVNDENGASTDLLELEYEGSDEGTQLTSQDIDINGGDGGYWFIGAQRNDPSWDKFSAMSVLPSSESSQAWDSQGTPGASVASGILNISTSSTTGYYDRTSNDEYVDLTQQTIEFKCRLNSTDNNLLDTTACGVRVADTSIDRGFNLNINTNACHLLWGYDGDEHAVSIQGNFTDWKHFRITSTGTETADTDCTISLYIDGVLMYTGTNDVTENEASDRMEFGVVESSTTDCDWEYFKICETSAAAPVSASSQGNIDSFGIARSVIDDTLLTALQSSRVVDVFASHPFYGPTLPPPKRFAYSNTGASLNITGTTYEDLEECVYYVAGDGVTEFDFRAKAVARNGTPGSGVFMAIDIDNDINGDTASLSAITSPFAYMEDPDGNNEITLAVERAEVLPVGLSEVRPQVADDGGTGIITRASKSFNVSIRKERRLG